MRRSFDRSSSFKKHEPGAGRRRRTETTLTLRKQKKHDHLTAKRRANDDFGTTLPATQPTAFAVEQIPVFIGVIRNPGCSREERLMAVRGLRRLASVAPNPPLQQLVYYGVFPVLTQLLSADEDAMIQYEAAWALTNVASTDCTLEVVNAGATRALVRLLDSPTMNVCDQAAWGLGNIAGHSPELRDHVLNLGAIPLLIRNLERFAEASFVKNSMWTISNLCRRKPPPKLDDVKACIPVAASVITNFSRHAEIVCDCLWTLSYISDGDDSNIQAIIDGQVLHLVMCAFQAKELAFVSPAIRLLGNVVTGNTQQTQAVLDAGVLSIAFDLLQCPKMAIRKDTAWMLSNIAASDSPQQVATLFEDPNLKIVSAMVDISRTSAWKIRREAVHFVANILTEGNPKQVGIVVEMDGLESLCDCLIVTDTSVVLAALSGIQRALQVSKELGKRYHVYVEECDGIAKLETLQESASEKVYSLVVAILEEFFGAEDHDECIENIVPSTHDTHFGFGVSPSKILFGSPNQHLLPFGPPATADAATQSPAAKSDFGSATLGESPAFSGFHNSNY